MCYSDIISDLDILPVVSMSVTSETSPGIYTLEASGGSDDNYDFTLLGGTLTVNERLSEPEEENIKIFPNPTQDYVVIQSASAGQVELYDMKGKKVMMSDKIGTPISIRDLSKGLYTMVLRDNNGVVISINTIAKK
ncbi:MAG: T9SS type A sorting domain-containing protein [Bacteroidota bacterium]